MQDMISVDRLEAGVVEHWAGMAQKGLHKPGLADRMRFIRLVFGYDNQRHWAEHLGVSFQSWNNYEKGEDEDRRPEIDAAIKICQKTGVTLDYIYLGDKDGLTARMMAEITKVEENAEREHKSDRHSSKPRGRSALS